MPEVTRLDDRRPNDRRCYLVAHLKTDCSPPKLLGVGTYSEPAGSLSGAIGPRRFAFDVTYADGPTYDEARRRLLGMPEPWRAAYQWAFDMLPASEGGEG